ncbi:phosphoribosyltransferase family protein [Psychrobacillus sp. FSL W7-1457]|uniref:phosphoribosyltransferase family protein n=1 Tax=unclassified Psychrobacillus TaxID=2636677 RepID=UPI0030FAB6B5
MKMLPHTTLSATSRTYNLHGNLKLTIDVQNNPYNLNPDKLFEMGVRINKKRQFLFISRLLGKHLPVAPSLSLGTGTVLASMLMENEGLPAHPQLMDIIQMIDSGQSDRTLSLNSLKYKVKLPTNTVFIGFAETATGLGHAVFNHFDKAQYIHTTREEIINLSPSFVFEEEHSHATSHRVYASENVLKEAETIVLIDDEITSGLTLSNLIISLNKKFPKKQFKILSILDWRSVENINNFTDLMKQNGIHAEIISILSGQFTLHNTATINEEAIPYLKGGEEVHVSLEDDIPSQCTTPYFSEHAIYSTLTGRFGLTSENHAAMDDWIHKLLEKLKLDRDQPTLVIGIGENIYIPSRIALALGKHTKIQTTTRSPIFAKNEEHYPIKSKCKFILPDSNDVEQYLYNVAEHEFEQILVVAESVKNKETWSPLLNYLHGKGSVTWLSLTSPANRGGLDDA